MHVSYKLINMYKNSPKILWRSNDQKKRKDKLMGVEEISRGRNKKKKEWVTANITGLCSQYTQYC